MVVINGDTGIDTIQDGKVTSSDLVSSIALTGTPTAPTAAAGTNTTQLATTAFAMGAGLGSNQTWQDVTSSRQLGTTYTNTTGKPIYISFYGSSNASTDFQIYINGTLYVILNEGSNHWGGASAIIPNGATYKCQITSGTPSLNKWSELR
jgi:hypothetical protein